MPQQLPKHSYLFVSLGEVRPVHFIHSHDYSHHILAVHNGGSQDVLGLVLREGVHEVTEVLILKEGREMRRGGQMKSTGNKIPQSPRCPSQGRGGGDSLFPSEKRTKTFLFSPLQQDKAIREDACPGSPQS